MLSVRASRVGMGLLLGLIIAAGGAGAKTIRVSLDFSAPTLRPAEAGAVVVEVPECVTSNQPGLPLLPMRGATILLPPGEDVAAVRATRVGVHALEGRYQVVPAQAPRPISAPGPFPVTPPDAAVYGSDALYPEAPARLVTVQQGWGHGLAFLRVWPTHYRPASGTLDWCERIEIEVETAPRAGVDARHLPNLRHDPKVIARLTDRVLNPGDLALYEGAVATPIEGSRLDPEFVPYVIITTEAFASGFAELATFHSSRGLRARVMLLSQIAMDYAGVDEAEQIRNFILDAYANWQTEFVLLGGDLGVVPVRSLYVDAGGTIDAFPGDCYFEGLDGTWNADGDDRWGELGNGEYDLVGEVAVGRASIDDATQLANWLHKNIMYTEHPVVSEIGKALFLGEQLDSYTWGDDSMDDVKDYCCNHGYCTSGYPNDYEKGTLYDRVGWTGWDAIQAFSSGYPSSHHLGHSNTTYNMKLGNGDLQYFTNDGVTHSYTFPYTQGCYAGNFDSNSPDAIAEVFIYSEHAAAAFVGCTRYGWYVPGTTAGPSQHFDRQFVDACYEEEMPQAGWMNVDSKIDCVWQLDPWMQWCHYELCLLGDPAMPQWRSYQGALELVHDGGLVLGQTDYPVLVQQNGVPVPGATVTVYANDLTVWDSGTTGLDGTLMLHPDPLQAMTLRLKAVKPDHLPALDSLTVAPSSGPWVVLSETALDDDAVGPSFGDGDGLADVGETLQLRLELHNVGADPAVDVAVVLTCADPRVVISDGAAAYGVLAPGARGMNLDDLVATVATDVPDGTEAWLDLTVTANERTIWESGFPLGLHAPILTLAGWSIDDTATGDGQGDADPSETFDLHVVLANGGTDEGRGITATLACGSGFVQLDQAQSGCALVPAGGTAEFDPPFTATLRWDAPTDSILSFELPVTAWTGETTLLRFDVPVASVVDEDFEAETGWRVGALGDNATAGLWVRVDPIGTSMGGRPAQTEDDHSPLGTQCFVTGQGSVGGIAPSSDVDGGRTTLISPRYDLRGANGPRLVYWRWYTNNLGSYPNQDTWLVQISDNGGISWITLEQTTESRNEWVRMEFALEDYINLTNQVMIRFIASDLNGDSLVEAAIDDLAVETEPIEPSAAPEGPGVPAGFGIHALSPNPLGGIAGAGVKIAYGLPAAGKASLQLFDVTGGLIRTLAQGARPAGEHHVVWDGRDANGAVSPSGIYFLRLRSAGAASQARLVVVR